MPSYCFECKCGEEWEEIFRMNDEKISKCKKCGNIGNRVFTIPSSSIDAKINPYDLDALTKKSGQIKGGTIGNLWDMAREASEKRGGKDDPIRKRALQEYAKKRKGKKYKGFDKTKSVGVEFR